jgi:hypothetical protein
VSGIRIGALGTPMDFVLFFTKSTVNGRAALAVLQQRCRPTGATLPTWSSPKRWNAEFPSMTRG